MTTQMNPLAQLGQLGQQQPSTSPFGQQGMGQQPQYGQQQPYGQQMQQPFGQMQQPQQQGGMLEQLQQLGQQQPFQQLLQQFGQQGQVGQQEQQQEQQVLQHLHQVTQQAVQQVQQQVQQQALRAGRATAFVAIPQPVPGTPRQIFLQIENQFRVLNNPNDITFREVSEAFRSGFQVIGVWDSQTPHILRSIQIRKV